MSGYGAATTLAMLMLGPGSLVIFGVFLWSAYRDHRRRDAPRVDQTPVPDSTDSKV